MNRILIVLFLACVTARCAIIPNPATTNSQPNVKADIASAATNDSFGHLIGGANAFVSNPATTNQEPNVTANTSTTSSNLVNQYMQIKGVQGATNPFIRVNATNVIINSNRFHITETAGSPFLISTDGVFAGMRSGFQVEQANGSTFDQMIITKVLSPTQAVAIAATLGYPSFPPTTVNNNTNFQIRPPVATISDDTIGAENNGTWMDENGMPWFSGINDQGTIYFINPVNGTMATLGMATEGSVGLNSGLNNVIFGFSGMVTNTSQAAQPLVFYYDTASPNESMGILPVSGSIAIGSGSNPAGGITNRHGGAEPFLPLWVKPSFKSTNAYTTTSLPMTNMCGIWASNNGVNNQMSVWIDVNVAGTVRHLNLGVAQ